MDKRTVLFVIALSLTLFGVNLFFEQRNVAAKQEWNAQQLVKKAQEQELLKTKIASRTASAASLPLSEIYSETEEKTFLSTGILDGNHILTLSWTEEMPAKVFAKKEAYTLRYSTKEIGSPAVYEKGTATPLTIGNLPNFGAFDLQVVFLYPHDKKHSYGITLGEYTDGHFSLPQGGLDTTEESLLEKLIHDSKPKFIGIALLKTSDGYLPVGFYSDERKSMVEFDELNGLAAIVKKQQDKTAITSSEKPQEKFYVLENDYQQLVFSNYGGALVEINLPFRNDKNKVSVVREIEFDRDMVANHPYNAHFPAHAYYTPSKAGTGSFEEHAAGQLGGYYPLLRRDLIQKGKWKSVHIPPQYYSLNIVSEYPEVAELVYEVKKFDNQSIVFESSQSHRRITKTYAFDAGKGAAPYIINATIKVDGDSRGLWLSTGVPEVELISGSPAPALKYRITRNNKSDVENLDLPADAMTVTSIYPDWVCNSNGFLGMIIDPLTEIDPGYRSQYVSGVTVPSRLVEIDQEYNLHKAANMPGYMMLLPLNSKGGTMEFRLFAGPFDDEILKAVDQTYSDASTGYNPDYVACQTFHGWFSFISEPFAKLLLMLMKMFYFVTGSWALSIVLLTISLRIMMYPLNTWSTKSMVKMQQIAPEVTAIQEKYKKDPKKAQIEVINLYRDRGVNPASGCLPLLIQMPFLIGMFDLLKSSFALRGASFIPGWIDDLTAPDVLFRWDYPIFFIGNEFHLLPILLGGVMFAQQRFFSTGPKDVNQMTDQQRQQKVMGNMMAVVFAVMFYNFPSGLNIYWLSSMLLGMAQQWYTTKQMKIKKK